MTVSDANDSESKERIEYLFKIISRYDSYINSTNAKASLLFAWNGLVIGTVLVKYAEILSAFGVGGWRSLAALLLLLLALASATSTLFVFQAVLPYLKPTDNLRAGGIVSEDSALFFGAVANLTATEFKDKISTMTPAQQIADLSDQAVILAKGLSKKMSALKRGLFIAMSHPVIALTLVLIKFFVF